jgi:hypothetical protein
MPTQSAVRAIVASLAVLALPLAAAAQSGAQQNYRPYRALFGGDPNDSQAVNLNVQIFAGYDDNVLAHGERSVDPRFQKSGYFTGATAAVSYQHAGDDVSFGVTGTTGIRYYPDNSDVIGVSHGVSGYVTLRPMKKTTLQTRAGYLWTPLYGVLVSPVSQGDPASSVTLGDLGSSADYAVSANYATTSYAAEDVSYALSQRMSLSGGYEFRYIDFDDQRWSQRHDTVRGGFGYRTTRYSTFRVGVSRRQYRVQSLPSSQAVTDVSAGFDYGRPLSLSGRRTSLTFRPGFQIMKRNNDLQVRLSGSVVLLHEMGRTWSAQASYNRGMRFVQGVGQEIFADTVQAGIAGLVTRRIEFGSGVTYSSGRSTTSGGNSYGTFSSSARLGYALSRNVSLFTQYFYLHYRFDDSVVLPAGTPRDLGRQGVRVGLALWAPLSR